MYKTWLIVSLPTATSVQVTLSHHSCECSEQWVSELFNTCFDALSPTFGLLQALSDACVVTPIESSQGFTLTNSSLPNVSLLNRSTCVYVSKKSQHNFCNLYWFSIMQSKMFEHLNVLSSSFVQTHREITELQQILQRKMSASAKCVLLRQLFLELVTKSLVLLRELPKPG